MGSNTISRIGAAGGDQLLDVGGGLEHRVGSLPNLHQRDVHAPVVTGDAAHHGRCRARSADVDAEHQRLISDLVDGAALARQAPGGSH